VAVDPGGYHHGPGAARSVAGRLVAEVVGIVHCVGWLHRSHWRILSMSNDSEMPELHDVATSGDYSPGVVMGNYTVNVPLKPTSVSLAEAFKTRLSFRPSDRGYFTEIGNRQIFVNGCKLEINLGNGGLSDLMIGLFRLSIEYEESSPLLMVDKERRYGGIFLPHQLFVDLYRDSAPGWWLISDGTSHGEPRRFKDAGTDLLESGASPRLRFRLKPGELEVIEGGLIPRAEGLFKVRFVFGVTSATQQISRQTKEIFIMQASAKDGR
jgi:hypothetical protein